jgi:hypothetical protein
MTRAAIPITMALLISFARPPAPTGPKRCTVAQNDLSTGSTVVKTAKSVPTNAPRIPSCACTFPPVNGASANPIPSADSSCARSAVDASEDVPVSMTVCRPGIRAGFILETTSSTTLEFGRQRIMVSDAATSSKQPEASVAPKAVRLSMGERLVFPSTVTE